MTISTVILSITDIISLLLSLAKSFIAVLTQRWPRFYSYRLIQDLWSVSYEHTLIDLKEETLKGERCETHLLYRVFHGGINLMVMAQSYSLQYQLHICHVVAMDNFKMYIRYKQCCAFVSPVQ